MRHVIKPRAGVAGAVGVMIMSAGSPSSLDSISPARSAPAQASNEKRRMAIGIAVLLVCFLAGGGVIWWFFYGSAPARTQVRVDPKDQALGYGRHGRRMPQPRAIQRSGADSWSVHGSKGEMKVKKTDGALELGSFNYVGGLGVSQEQLTLLTSRWRILRDPAMAKAWGITSEQRSKLAKLKGTGGFNPTKAEREGLIQMFIAYQDASDGTARGDAERKVLDEIDRLAGQSFDATHAAYVERADQIRQILTAKQIKKILKR
jgi:hypothetical protein